jgi:hypothetical protein
VKYDHHDKECKVPKRRRKSPSKHKPKEDSNNSFRSPSSFKGDIAEFVVVNFDCGAFIEESRDKTESKIKHCHYYSPCCEVYEYTVWRVKEEVGE